MYVSSAGVTSAALGSEGRFFVRDLGATLPGQGIQQTSVYAAQAADILLDAIARSDGTRASVTRKLLASRVRGGILGTFRFDPQGDTTSNPVTILRALRGGGSDTVLSNEGAAVVRVLRPPARLLR
jgi:ABC-type branched-subunit amino acid transport system substrate-binding protein